MQNPLDISVSTKPQYDNASGHKQISSPSLAEGVRGWVDSTSASQAKSVTAKNKNATANNASANFASISKADSALSAKSAKDTHPQTPSAREGASRKANSAVCHTTTSCHTEGIARNISKDSANNAKYVICHTERSEVSQKQNRDISLSLNMTTENGWQDNKDISVSTKPQYDNLNTLDNVCHTEGVARSISKDSANNAKSIICHTERSEVSKNASANVQNPLDISVSAKPQYDNVISTQSICHTERSEVSQEVSQVVSNRDISLVLNMTTKNGQHGKPKSAHTPSKPKRLALSLAAAGIIAGIGIDIAAAACNGREDWSQGDANSNGIGRYQRVDCTGVSDNMAYFFANDQGYFRPSYYRETRWYLSGSTNNAAVTSTFSTSRWIYRPQDKSQVYEEVNFNGLQAAGTDFTFTNETANQVRFRITSSGGSNLKSLKVVGNVSNNINIASSTIGTFSTTSGTTGYTINIASVSNIGTMDIRSATNALLIDGGSRVTSLSGNGTINELAIRGSGGERHTQVTSIDATGEIKKLTLGASSSDNPLLNPNIKAKVSTLLIYGASVTIDKGADWNNPTADGQRFSVADNLIAAGFGATDGSISINIGNNADRDTEYELKNLLVSNNKAIGTSLRKSHINTEVRGAEVVWVSNDKFRLKANASNTYATDVYRSLAMSNMRRNAMTENILNTMTTKTFHSDRYYNQEVELRLLQYDLSRLTNRSSKFSKQTRKNQSKVDKVREKMAKLTLEQSKGQNLDKGYNNFELIDQLDAIFIPYTGRRDWRFFALPYASHTYAYLGNAETTEWAGGALFGVQRNLRAAGIFGGYVGYEFANTDSGLLSSPSRVQTHSLQAGLNYFKTFAITSKVWEGFIKANVRGGVDLPQLSFNAAGKTNTIESDAKGVSIPLMYNLGASVSGGLTFYQFKRNSYVSPEVGLSYDMLSTLAMKLIKPVIKTDTVDLQPIGANEFYGATFFHLPQLSVSARYYKMWGNTFRTNLKAGIKYNMMNVQTLGSFRYGNIVDDEERKITLPAVYGNLAFDLIWLIKKNHELSLGYDGLFFASTFSKNSTNDWFNGVTTNVNFKYAYWFGGSDYVTDKDGNAVSRSIAEGKKSKKGKKSKSKKKSKKSKKKVYYIDG